MLELYSMTREGRPRWALAATFVLFAVTTVLAGIVAHQVSNPAGIKFGESRSFAGLGIRASLPVGWEAKDPLRMRGGELLAVAEPGKAKVRELFVFRARPVGRDAIQQALMKALEAAGVERESVSLLPSSRGMLAGFASIVFDLEIESSGQPSGGRAIVAVTSDDCILGVVLLVPEQFTRADQSLIRQFSESIAYDPAEDAPQPKREPRRRGRETHDDGDGSPKPVASPGKGVEPFPDDAVFSPLAGKSAAAYPGVMLPAC